MAALSFVAAAGRTKSSEGISGTSAMKRIMLLAGLCLLLAAFSACSGNRGGRVADGGESGVGGQEQDNGLLSHAPSIDPAAGSAAGTASAGTRSRAPTNSGDSDWH